MLFNKPFLGLSQSIFFFIIIKNPRLVLLIYSLRSRTISTFGRLPMRGYKSATPATSTSSTTCTQWALYLRRYKRSRHQYTCGVVPQLRRLSVAERGFCDNTSNCLRWHQYPTKTLHPCLHLCWTFFNVFDRLWLITALFYLPSFAEAISDLELHQRGLCLNVARSWKLWPRASPARFERSSPQLFCSFNSASENA